MLTDVNPVTRVAGHQLYGTHHQIGVGQIPMNKPVSFNCPDPPSQILSNISFLLLHLQN